MPLYEFYCPSCRTGTTLMLSVEEAERARGKKVICPKCGSAVEPVAIVQERARIGVAQSTPRAAAAATPAAPPERLLSAGQSEELRHVADEVVGRILTELARTMHGELTQLEERLLGVVNQRLGNFEYYLDTRWPERLREEITRLVEERVVSIGPGRPGPAARAGFRDYLGALFPS